MALFEQIAYGAQDYEAAITAALRRDGVVAVTNVLTDDECTQHMTELVESLKTINRKLSIRQWKPAMLPAGPRDGLFQSLVGQLPAVWS